MIRVSTHPGEMLLKEFRVNEIVNERRGITLSTALRLGKYFGTSADFWRNLQLRCDLYKTWKEELARNRANFYALSLSCTFTITLAAL